MRHNGATATSAGRVVKTHIWMNIRTCSAHRRTSLVGKTTLFPWVLFLIVYFVKSWSEKSSNGRPRHGSGSFLSFSGFGGIISALYLRFCSGIRYSIVFSAGRTISWMRSIFSNGTLEMSSINSTGRSLVVRSVDVWPVENNRSIFPCRIVLVVLLLAGFLLKELVK